MADNDFAHLRVRPQTHSRIKVLAAVQGMTMDELAAQLVDTAWQAAIRDGLVSNPGGPMRRTDAARAAEGKE